MEENIRKFLIAFVALVALAILVLPGADKSVAAGAANYSKIPHLGSLLGSNVQTVDWKIYHKWYNGCNRWRWCKSRRHNGYKYVYYNCYWGACYSGGGGSGSY